MIQVLQNKLSHGLSQLKEMGSTLEKKAEEKEIMQKLQSKISELKKKSSTLVKKKAEEKIFLQFGGQEVVLEDIMEKAKEKFCAEGHEEADIKSIRLYLKPEENMAYYIINDESSNKVSLI